MKPRTAFLALIAFVPSVVGAQRIGVPPDSVARTFYREHEKEYSAERVAMAATRGRASRSAGTLRLRLSSGKIDTFVDTIAEGDGHHRYLYAGYLRAQHLHVVEQWFYEGGLYLIIHDPSGQSGVIPGSPTLSPDGERFASASLDLEAGYEPNRLEIWTVGPKGLHRQFALEGTASWGPDSVQWKANGVLRFVRTSMNQGTGAVARAPRWVTLSGGRWRISSRAP